MKSRRHQAALKALEENLFHTFLLASRRADPQHTPSLVDNLLHSRSPTWRCILLVCLHVVFMWTCLCVSPLLIRTAALLESG